MFDWPQMLCDTDASRPIEGSDESVAALRVRIGGRPAVLIWCRFEVAAGTLSVAGGRRFVDAVDAACADGCPVVAIANSGGARMQEGTRAFVQMIRCTEAVRRLEAAGLPLLVYLADPTMGGVLASWASLAHVTLAQPGATIGFTGPRVAGALGEPILPADTQVAEGLFANGLVDELVEPQQLRERVAEILAALDPSTRDASTIEYAEVVGRNLEPGGSAGGPSASDPDALSGWAAVEHSRRPGRTCVLDELQRRATERVTLRGDRLGGVDPAVYAGILRIDGIPMVVIGHTTGDDAGGRPTAAGLRLATRAMRIAEVLGLPVVTVIDTPGARIGGDQEATGFAGVVARSIETMLGLDVPTVAVVAGQGSGGAAIAWLAADRVLIASDGWVAPIAPEAGAVILRRQGDGAEQLADLQRVGAAELVQDGIVDTVHEVGELAAAALAAVAALGRPAGRPDRSLRAARFDGTEQR